MKTMASAKQVFPYFQATQFYQFLLTPLPLLQMSALNHHICLD